MCKKTKKKTFFYPSSFKTYPFSLFLQSTFLKFNYTNKSRVSKMIFLFKGINFNHKKGKDWFLIRDILFIIVGWFNLSTVPLTLFSIQTISLSLSLSLFTVGKVGLMFRFIFSSKGMLHVVNHWLKKDVIIVPHLSSPF